MKHFYLQKGSLLCFLVTLLNYALAQSPDQKLKADVRVSAVMMDAQLKTPALIQFRPEAGIPASQAKSLIVKSYGLNTLHELRLLNSTAVGTQVKVEQYKQYFKGVKLEHSAFNVLIKNGQVAAISSEAYALDAAFSVVPQLAAATARTKALDFVQAAKYAWEAIEEDKRLYPGNVYMQQKLDALKNEYTPRGELVIARDVYGKGGPRLAYKFDVFAVQPLSRNIIYVDAITGRILLRDAVIKHLEKVRKDPKPDSLYYLPNYQYYRLVSKEHFRQKTPKPFASVPGTGLTRYAGVRQIYTTKITVPLTGTQDPNNPTLPLTYSGTELKTSVVGRDVYVLIDDTRGGGIETYDCNGIGGVPLSLPQIQEQATAFVDKDNNWKDETDNGVVTQEDLIRGLTRDGSVGANEAFNDDIAIDAHWGAGLVYDYWKNVHNRLSYDNKNSAIKSYIHYGPAYDNAFWNGSSMTYGDGSGTAVGGGFRPLVSLDVCGHEIGHGVCTFTSDLVYESESGAMNEGLSDIWAAAIERYAIENVDATLDYEYFQIGEQIAADNEGLRRMDNPKRYSNPDTYGGENWSNPDCVPNLANDQCGVHNNSGVLNKWFYLLVMGPKKTTGSPAYTDDGVADKPRTTPDGNDFVPDDGNNYGALAEFVGIGFEKAEQITYLMELALTPNAKFASARAASIAAAQVLYGPCSQEEISVHDAWFGVNVGPAWSGCTAPVLSVNVLDTAVTEGSGDCGTFSDIKLGVFLRTAQAGTTTINFSTAGSTAEDHDYDLLPGTGVSYAAGETGNKIVTLRIYNDDLVEGTEVINLAGTSNFAGFTFGRTIIIMDDDVLPKLGNTFTLLTETFEATPNDQLPAGWDTVNKTDPTGGLWNVRSPQPTVLTWATKRAYIYNPNLLINPRSAAIYDPTIGTSVILRTPLIDARGLDSIRLQFIWSAGGEGACSPACDYGEVLYSFDGVTFNRFDVDTSGTEAKTASEPLYLSTTDSTYSQVLPKVVSNRQFYIGFRWVNDELATINPSSITIDNVVVTGQGRNVESDSMAAVQTSLPSEPGAPAFLYSKNDKGLLSSIENPGADLGCVRDTLIQTGPGVVPYQNTQRSRKVHQITASENTGTSYTLTLYYTAAEVAGFTVPPSQLRILKSNAATIDQSGPANSQIVTPTFIDSSNQGFYGYRASFTGFSKFALVSPLAAPLPVTCVDFSAVKAASSVALMWKVAGEEAGTRYEVERSTDGTAFSRIGMLPSNGGGSYAFTDNQVTGLRAAHYRISEVAANGAKRYLCTVLFVPFDNRNVFNIGPVYPNPGRGEATVNVSLSSPQTLRVEYVNTVGQVVTVQRLVLPAGATQMPLSVRSLAAGSYLVRFKDEDGTVVNTQQFIKQ